MKYSFKNDYTELGYDSILTVLSQINREQLAGYGDDKYCVQARSRIKEMLNNANVDIHFVVGGTQANLLVISSILKPYESVIAVESSHICIHEAGAIESNGHKINVANSIDGKLTIQGIKQILDLHTDEHMVKPRMVFVSNLTEIGTVYTKNELKEISDFCKMNNLLLYLDGARLGVALTSEVNDLTLEELCSLVDVFYIGGTKNGAMLGEAIVIVNDKIKENFRYMMKQKGALTAKSGLIGIQFNELFKNDLYFKLAKNANRMAVKIAKSIERLGYKFLCPYMTNQIFPILPNDLIFKLQEKYDFYIWQRFDDDNSVIRLVTSWATNEEAVDEFISDLK